MLVPISTYNSSDNFKNFRETFVEEIATNFELLDNKFSTYNVDDMLQKRISQTNSCAYLFYYYDGNNVNFIAGLDTSNATSMNYMFGFCRSLTTIPAFDTSNVTNMSYMFYNCFKITTIPQLDTNSVTDMRSMFYNCTNIEQIHLLNIGADLDIHYSTKMEREALLEVLGNLKDLTGATSKRLTLGSTLLNKLTDDDKAIATNKNWTLA